MTNVYLVLEGNQTNIVSNALDSNSITLDETLVSSLAALLAFLFLNTTILWLLGGFVW